jgi:hypothetical protein
LPEAVRPRWSFIKSQHSPSCDRKFTVEYRGWRAASVQVLPEWNKSQVYLLALGDFALRLVPGDPEILSKMQ